MRNLIWTVIGVCLFGWFVGVTVLWFFDQVRAAEEHRSTLIAAAEKRAAEGEPVLQAIYRYKARVGLFPMSLEDVSGELSPDVLEGWSFFWRPHRWRLWCHVPTQDGSCDLRFSGEAWSAIVGREDMPRLDVKPDLSVGESPSPEVLRLRTIEELESRIRADDERYTSYGQHCQGLVSFLWKNEFLEQAGTWCIEMRDLAVEPWWAEQVLARVRHAQGKTELAAQELRQRIEADPSFIRWTYLASFYRETGQLTEAVAVLKEAVRHDLADEEDTGRMPWAYASEAGAFAYHQGEFELVVAICDVWESFEESGSDSYRSMRAAANLALGRFDAARVDADQATAEAPWRTDFDARGPSVDFFYQ